MNLIKKLAKKYRMFIITRFFRVIRWYYKSSKTEAEKVAYNELCMSFATELLLKVDFHFSNNLALWDSAQNEMEKQTNRDRAKLLVLGNMMEILAHRARERAGDIADEDAIAAAKIIRN